MSTHSLRCFVAIEPDDAVREVLVGSVLPRLPDARGVRWCSAGQLHITLKFIAEIEETRLDALRAHLREVTARIAPFTLELSEFGLFPDPRRPRVFWLGAPDAAGACQAWLNAADPLLAGLGIEPETRPLHPHITLGRSRSPEGGRLMTSLLAKLRPPQASWQVRRLTLFESRLGPQGAEYLPLDHFPLSGVMSDG